MAAQLRTYTEPGLQDPIDLDYFDIRNTTLATWLAPGVVAAYGLEFTLDDVSTPDNVNARWYRSDKMPAGTDASAVAVIDFPVRAVRLNITALVGKLEFRVLQNA